jgi:hypothetical protein
MSKTTVAVGCLLALGLVGCVTSSFTNLTPSELPRNPTGQYLIECAWESNQQTVRPETIKPYVIVGFDAYEMRRVPKLTNRWETYIPVPAGQNAVRYHFKVDYEYSKFGKKPGKASVISPEYKLMVVEKQ